MPSNNDQRDAQALDYDPLYDKSQYVKDYKEIKKKGKREGHPDVQPHHIRGLNNYHDPWKHLTPENRYIMQAELEPYGLQFGNIKDNLVAAEGQWSKSKPGETRYGGQHALLHNRQETVMQEMGVIRYKGAYRGVAGVPWKDMTQKQIMDILRNMAISDETTMNRTLSNALPLSSNPNKPKPNPKPPEFGNRLVNRPNTVQLPSVKSYRGAMKLVPFAGAGIALGSAAQSAKAGDYMGATGHLIEGVVGEVPVVGDALVDAAQGTAVADGTIQGAKKKAAQVKTQRQQKPTQYGYHGPDVPKPKPTYQKNRDKLNANRRSNKPTTTSKPNKTTCKVNRRGRKVCK